MKITGKQFECDIGKRHMRIHNQHSPEWIHPYPHETEPDATLNSAGCGIFALCHAIEFLSGLRLRPESLADFSVAHGGRGDDGTDRPALLRALSETGEARNLGFRFVGGENLNDLKKLWSHLSGGEGAALCNVRPGHIVCLLGAREIMEEQQVLVLDSNPTLKNEAQYQAIREIVPGSEIIFPTVNQKGVRTGYAMQAAAFFVPLKIVRDYNLLYRL